MEKYQDSDYVFVQNYTININDLEITDIIGPKGRHKWGRKSKYKNNVDKIKSHYWKISAKKHETENYTFYP